MTKNQDNIGNQSAMSFGGEVPYAFGWLPINAELNRQIFARAIEREKIKAIDQQSISENSE